MIVYLRSRAVWSSEHQCDVAQCSHAELTRAMDVSRETIKESSRTLVRKRFVVGVVPGTGGHVTQYLLVHDDRRFTLQPQA